MSQNLRKRPRPDRVLVVDDSVGVAESVADVLTSMGLDVTGVASDGSEALEAARQTPPDLVVMDIGLPGPLDGIEAAEALVRDHPSLSVLFVTGRADGATVERALRAGAHAYLVKPVRRDQLAAAVEVALGIGRREREWTRELSDVASDIPFPPDPAGRDPLTGLVGRRRLAEQGDRILALAERRGSRAGVVVLDLARFAHVNASLGYGLGDRVLEEVAERLLGRVRESDILARAGGDEFVVLMTDVEEVGGAVAGARRLVEALAEPIRLGDVSLRLTLEAGVALYPAHGRDVETLHQAADTALHHGKENGRPVTVYRREEGDARPPAALPVASDLQRALEEGQLEVHYQPICRLPDAELAGMEALVRWNHPERGTLTAGDFVPLAENLKLIREIDDWMLRHVVGDLAAWPVDPSPGWVSINLSAASVRDSDVPGRIRELLGAGSEGARRRGAPRLVVEITERCAVREFGAVTEALLRLRRLGVRVALDDFGTGHSSLLYLDRLPVEFIKLDRRFLHDVDASDEGGRLTAAIVELGRALEMTVIAEGVERSSQFEWVKNTRVDLVQGYLTGEPSPMSPGRR